MRIAFTTLGCKINQYESDHMRQAFKDRGSIIVPFDSDADVYIINTCSVTAKTDYECRQAIRAAAGRKHGAQVVVTGCYASTRPDEVKKIPGVDLVCGNHEKSMIPDLVMRAHAALVEAASMPQDLAAEQSVQDRTRGFLKIQDGCDNRCSYCIVPLARGNSRSVLPSDVITDFENLISIGCPEIVLSGIHIGTYGKDLAHATSLSILLMELMKRRGGTRIRLSSIEPREITNEIIDLLGHGLCRHLHIPLQSGDDTILRSMKRDYSSTFYLELIERIADRVPGMALGADVMVGYPGEGEEAFQNTLRLIEKAPLTHLHVFSYSPRPGTVAADMKNQVPDRTKKERSQEVRELGKEKNLAFRKKQAGISLRAVVEANMDASTGLALGLTDNYIRTHISGVKPAHLRKEMGICIKEVNSGGNLAVIL
jgi:threonylcarbamoyladenosine tRNA methylthiotransferase MtaB